MKPVVDFLHGISPELAWLFAGFIVGRLSRNVETIATVVAEEGAAVSDEPVPRRRRWTFEKVGIAAIILIGLFSAGQAVFQESATREVANCTRTYSNEFAIAFEARAKANSEWQAALDDLMAEVGRLSSGVPTPESREAFRTALGKYLETREQAKRQQADHPLPPAPRAICQ